MARSLAVALITLMALVLVVAALADSSAPVSRSALRSPNGYRESVVPLPGFATLFDYTFNSNPDGDWGWSQVPVLANSPEQPAGIYYVNNASELVRTDPGPTVVAPITLLDQGWSEYPGMLQNEFYLPYGYDEALFFGTLPNRGDVSVETVNLTTGAVALQTTAIPAMPSNQGVVLVSSTEALVISADNGSNQVTVGANVTAVNLTTGAEQAVADLPFFEANNVYWIPQLQQLIDVEAHGSDGDLVEQWNWTGARLVLASTVEFDYEFVVNWADGLAYNATAGEIAFTAGAYGSSDTFVLSYRDGLLTGPLGPTYIASTYDDAYSAQEINDQYSIDTGDWVVGGFFNGTQYLFDPWNGTTVPVNEPFTDLTGFDVCDGSCFLGQDGVSELIDFHATVARNDPFWSVVVATSS